MFYVYLHSKPDGTPFYVGKGGDRNGKRSRNFCQRNKYHNAVVAECGRENVLINLFEFDSEASAYNYEMFLIDLLRESGHVLCNMNSGSGSRGYWQFRDSVSDK